MSVEISVKARFTADTRSITLNWKRFQRFLNAIDFLGRCQAAQGAPYAKGASSVKVPFILASCAQCSAKIVTKCLYSRSREDSSADATTRGCTWPNFRRSLDESTFPRFAVTRN